MSEPTVERVDAIHHYEIKVDTEVAGFINYRAHGDRLVFLHTEIDTAFAGQGLGTRLIVGALADVHESGTRIVALCPMVAAYLVKNRDYDDIIDPPHVLDGPPVHQGHAIRLTTDHDPIRRS